MKECEICKAKREEQKLRLILGKLFISVANCQPKAVAVRKEMLNALVDHGVGLIFNIFYPKE